MSRDVTGQARDESSPTALLQMAGGGRGKQGHSFLKVPSPHGLEKMALLYDIA